MNSNQQKKFADLIISECVREVSREPSPKLRSSWLTADTKKYQSQDSSLTKEMSIMLIGVFTLLIACVMLFDGLMVPAMWQLTSVFWLFWRISKIKI